MLDNIPLLSVHSQCFYRYWFAAASGFRVFLPMFAVSLASYMGWIPMNDHFMWLVWFAYTYYHRNCHHCRGFGILYSLCRSLIRYYFCSIGYRSWFCIVCKSVCRFRNFPNLGFGINLGGGTAAGSYKLWICRN